MYVFVDGLSLQIMTFVLERMLENVLMNYNKLTKKELSIDKHI